jgi:nitrate reductase NapE component
MQQAALPMAQPKALKFIAQLISYIFHPIFIPIYVIAFLVFVHPDYFVGFSEKAKWQTLLISTINLTIFPLIAVGLLKALGFIDSILLHTQKDRIIPYMACGIFFFWAYTIFKKQPIYHPVMPSFVFGVFLASSAGLMANIYFKISMHALGVGGLLGIMGLLLFKHDTLLTWPFAAATLIAGMVCTARFIVSNHSQKDIYLGLLLGILCQVAASIVVGF